MRDVQAVDLLESLGTLPVQNEPARGGGEENAEAGEEKCKYGLDDEGDTPGHGVCEMDGAIAGKVTCAYT